MIPGFRLVRRLVLLVAILGLLFVGANVVAARIAEDKIAEVAQHEFDLEQKPEIHLKGMILFGLLRGELPGLTLEARDVEQQGLTIEDVTVELEGVRVSGVLGGTPSVTVREGSVRATVVEAALNVYLRERVGDVRITLGERGLAIISVRKDGRTYGARGTLRLVDSSLRFDPTSVTVDGRAPPPGFESFARRRATFAVRIPTLPGEIAVRSLETHRGRVTLTAVLRARTFTVAQ